MELVQTVIEKTILEVKEILGGGYQTFHCTPCVVSSDELIVLYRLPHDLIVEDIALPAGTVSFGYFWAKRCYNVYHWLASNSRTLGLYFNICDRTRITPRKVFWRDLIVDVLVTPDGRCRVLDEDELPQEIAPSLRRKIEAARDEVVRGHKALQPELERRSRDLARTIGITGESVTGNG